MDSRFAFCYTYSTWNQVLAYSRTPCIQVTEKSGIATRAIAPIANVSKKGVILLAYTISGLVSTLFSLLSLPYRCWIRAQMERELFAEDLSRLPEKEREAVRTEILDYINTHKMTGMPEGSKERAIQQAVAYYSRSKAVYGPIARGWVENLLARANQENRKLIFMARDGIAPYKLAKKLMESEEYKAKYPQLAQGGKIQLAYLSRKVLANGIKTPDLVKRYIEHELNIEPGDKCFFIDVGFEGSMIKKIREVIPKGALADFEFLVSITPKANGFLATEENPLESIPSAGINLGVQWLEDTHQGSLDSPKKLVEQGGHVYPNTLFPKKMRCAEKNHFQYLLRKFCMKAIVRTAADAPLEGAAFEKARKAFDETLLKIKRLELPVLVENEASFAQNEAGRSQSHTSSIQVTSAVFRTLASLKNRNAFEIKLNDSTFLVARKRMGQTARKALIYTAFAIAILSLPILLLTDTAHFAISKIRSFIYPTYVDYHYHLRAPTFDSYLSQMKEFADQMIQLHPILLPKNTYEDRFQNGVTSLIQFMQNPPGKTAPESTKLQFHQAVLDQLRKLLEKKEREPESQAPFIQILEELCEWIYMSPKLTEEMALFLKQEILSASSQNAMAAIDSSALSQFIRNSHKEILGLEKLNGLYQQPLLYDPHEMGDTPSHLFEIGREKAKTKIIRTPAVTRDLSRGNFGELAKAEVVQEFKAFLDSYQKKQKSHVYVNLMDRNGAESEGVRSRAIENLEKEYAGTLFVLTLAKDSPFYRQKGIFQYLSKGADFKAVFLKEMFRGGDSGFYWPSQFGGKWKERCKELLDQVHTRYFSNRDVLSRKERLDFIEIAYLEIIEEVLRAVQPESCNASCRTCIDRGASTLAGLYAKNRLESQGTLNQKECQEIATLTLTPAILAQSRAPFQERVDRLSSALDRMIKN